MSSFQDEQKKIVEKFANHGIRGLALEMGNVIMENFEAYFKQNQANCDIFQSLKGTKFLKLFYTYIHEQ